MQLPLQNKSIWMINRAIPPTINPISAVNFPEYKQITLDNGIRLFLIEGGSQPVLKMEVVFKAGRPFEDGHLVARATARMLKEGTKSFSSAKIADRTDFYGSTISLPINLDTSAVVFYSLTKHLEKLLPLWTEILTTPVFPERELSKIVKNNVERLKIDLSKNDVLAYRKITENLFGKEHPYGYNSFPVDYQNLSSSVLKKHFSQNYIAENCMIFLSGQPGPDCITLINKYLGSAIPRGESKTAHFPVFKEKPSIEMISNPGSPQTALRVGRVLFPRTHPDYCAFFMLNTILGGYFGSRLMTNLREKKGYTYNIYSSLDAMSKEGAFLIGAELSHENKDKALKEIFVEIERLRTELVQPKELEMVRSYLLGSFLSMIDGPFNVAEIVRTAEVENLGPNYFNNLVKAVQESTPETIQQMAYKYLPKEALSVVAVGG